MLLQIANPTGTKPMPRVAYAHAGRCLANGASYWDKLMQPRMHAACMPVNGEPC